VQSLIIPLLPNFHKLFFSLPQRILENKILIGHLSAKPEKVLKMIHAGRCCCSSHQLLLLLFLFLKFVFPSNFVMISKKW
jgi:hypothetical protein